MSTTPQYLRSIEVGEGNVKVVLPRGKGEEVVQIPVPLEKEFEIEWPNAGTFTVTLRQATGADDDIRATFERECFDQRRVSNPDGSSFAEWRRFDPESIVAEKVRLVLVSCSLVDSGRPLLRAGMDRADFQAAWGKIVPLVRTKMFWAVIELNPEWHPFPEIAKSDETDSE